MLGFIGGGAMAEALLKGIIASGSVPATKIWVSDIDENRRAYLSERLEINAVSDNFEILKNCELVFLAVKPQVAPAILADLEGMWHQDHLVVSIMAGVTLAILGQFTGPARLIRVMPNTPCLVGAGAAGVSGSPSATLADIAKVQKLLSFVSETVVLNEDLLDAVTGLSGSAPAYVYMFIEALADGGVLAGLPRQVAVTLAAQTVFGAAKMVLETKEHPAKLKDLVSSPAGTTIAGIAELEKGGFRGLVLKAVQAGAQRSVELGSR